MLISKNYGYRSENNMWAFNERALHVLIELRARKNPSIPQHLHSKHLVFYLPEISTTIWAQLLRDLYCLLTQLVEIFGENLWKYFRNIKKKIVHGQTWIRNLQVNLWKLVFFPPTLDKETIGKLTGFTSIESQSSP